MTPSERDAAVAVIDSEVLSGFLATPGDGWLGGPVVQQFERAWADAFGYRHAISVNSWTTGLVTSVGALGLGPGDEMICPPFTMSASATCAVLNGAQPVFADVDPETFVLDPRAVEKAITPRTKAILVVHLFGLPADMDALGEIGERHQIHIIEDAAQSPLARYRGRFVGALDRVGGFSLNYHKHIHTGEGGVIVTDVDEIADRCRSIRNHGENLADVRASAGRKATFGSNYRFTELQAAIGLVQLSRLAAIVEHRQQLAARLASKLDGCPGITLPTIPADRTHAFYLYPIRYDAAELEISRERFIGAVAAELPQPKSCEDIVLRPGYIQPLNLNPLYSQDGTRQVGLCPVAEQLYAEDLIVSFLVRDPLSLGDIDDVAHAISKVVERRRELKDQH